MKVVKRISFFLLSTSMLFLSGSYAALKMEHFFYPNRFGQTAYEEEKNTGIKTDKTIEEKIEKKIDDNLEDNTKYTANEEQVIEAVLENSPVITADTIYLVEKIDLSKGTIEEKAETIPVKYIGLDRESLLEELEAYDKNPPLSDLENGFETIELSGFSKDRVVICKYYRTQKEEQGFYLMVADHFVIVYKSDKKTIYMNTDILLETLSPTLQSEIIQGKYMADEQELYNFLESYSS